MNAEDTANHIFVDGNAESQGDLLGDAGTTPVAIPPFPFNDGVDEFFMRSFRARRTPALVRKQHAVLSFGQQVVEMQLAWMASGRWRNAERVPGSSKRVHRPAMKRSPALRLGARLRPRWRMRS